MAKVQILGDAVVLTSAIKSETLVKLAKYAPKSLKLVDKETKNELFAVGVGPVATATKHGVVFSGKNEEGFANATFQLSTGLSNEQKKAHVQDTLGFAILNLNKIEEQIAGAADELTAAFAQVQEAINIVE